MNLVLIAIIVAIFICSVIFAVLRNFTIAQYLVLSAIFLAVFFPLISGLK